jgi:hypothetical protein
MHLDMISDWLALCYMGVGFRLLLRACTTDKAAHHRHMVTMELLRETSLISGEIREVSPSNPVVTMHAA